MAETQTASMVVKARVQAMAHDAEVNVSSEFYDALDAYVADGIRKAAARSKGNGRKTLQAQDL